MYLYSYGIPTRDYNNMINIEIPSIINYSNNTKK